MPTWRAKSLAAGGIALSIGWAGTPSAAAEETIRVATWNIANLHHVVGEALRPGAAARSEEDYAILRKYARRMNADVIALQEVNGPRAARLVFPVEEYHLFFSGRYADDLAAGRESDRIYTGFAVRRGIFDGITKRDVSSLGVQHTDGRPVRWGTEIMVERDGRRMRLLSVHLKSGCAQGSLENPSDNDCKTLAAQRAPLEQWIDEATRETMPFAVRGDFNRRFDRFGQSDHLWGEIDDGDPTGLDLWRLPSGKESDCWRGTGRHFPQADRLPGVRRPRLAEGHPSDVPGDHLGQRGPGRGARHTIRSLSQNGRDAPLRVLLRSCGASPPRYKLRHGETAASGLGEAGLIVPRRVASRRLR